MIIRQRWPYKTRDVSSAWKGLEDYVIPIVNYFNINPKLALEFGVDLGYSADVLSQVFDKVVGVDGFLGDSQILHQQGDEFYNSILKSFENTNVEIVRSLYQDFINKHSNNKYDLIHIDIIHEYEPTFECADWSIQHSNLVMLHDTESYPQIKKVCYDIAAKHKVAFYNVTEHFGLGILYRK